MLNKKNVVIAQLILSLCVGTSFAGETQFNPNLGPQGQPGNDIEMGTLSSAEQAMNAEAASNQDPNQDEIIELDSLPRVAPGAPQQQEESSRNSTHESKPRRSGIRGFFANCTWKKAVAYCTVAAIVGGAAFYLSTSHIWNPEVPACKTISYPGSTICSFDSGEMVPNNPGDAKRGMYVSLWTDEVQNPAKNDKYVHILGNPVKEDYLLNFIERNKIDAISLYNLGAIFDLEGKAKLLSDFSIKAKQRGVKEIIAVINSKKALDISADYSMRYPGRVDGLVTEMEWWHAGLNNRDAAFKEFMEVIKHAKALGLTNLVTKKPIKIATYFGVLDRLDTYSATEVAEEVIRNTDRIYQHCYGTGVEKSNHDIVEAYADCKSKMAVWLATKQKMNKGVQSPEIVPILSAEGKNFYSINGLKTEYYLGPWIQAHPSLDAIEAESKAVMGNGLDIQQLSGFHYYEYMFLDDQINLGLNKTASTVSNKTATKP